MTDWTHVIHTPKECKTQEPPLTLQREAIAVGHVWGASPPPDHPQDIAPLNLMAVDPDAVVVITVSILGPKGAPWTAPQVLHLPSLKSRQRITIARQDGNIWAYREMPVDQKK